MGCSAVDVGLTGLFGIGSESVGGVFNSPKGFLLQSIKSGTIDVEQYLYYC